MAAQLELASVTKRLASRHVGFHPHSFADNAGRLFWCDRGLFRGIKSEHSAFFARMLREGVIERLVSRELLIETQLTDLELEDYPMVLSHRSVSFVSYPHEWCAPMLRDAALVIVDLALELAEIGLTLKDAHPWNVLFESCKPVYVDVTSIANQTTSSDWTAYDEFCRFCYYPLVLMYHGHERIARALLPEYRGVLREEVSAIMRGSPALRFILTKLLDRALEPIRAVFRNQPRRDVHLLRRMRIALENLSSPSFQDASEMLSETPFSVNGHQLTVWRLLRDLQPADVLDLSSSASWTSILPASRRINVVAATSLSSRAVALYEIARKERLPILPLLIDFIKPTPSIGYSDHYSIAATTRLKCDLVLAFGSLRQLVLENYFSLALIAEGLAAFSKRWVLVEFPDDFPHSLDDFIKALNKKFADVKIIFADPTTLLLCEKKR